VISATTGEGVEALWHRLVVALFSPSD
jgi:hypothetical protein